VPHSKYKPYRKPRKNKADDYFDFYQVGPDCKQRCYEKVHKLLSSRYSVKTLKKSDLLYLDQIQQLFLHCGSVQQTPLSLRQYDKINWLYNEVCRVLEF
jgi:hypothetical protein